MGAGRRDSVLDGSSTPELRWIAMRILGLCCTSSGCEKNWSTFDFFNQRLQARFQERREKSGIYDPIVLDELDWTCEWMTREDPNDLVYGEGDDLTWDYVDEALGASSAFEGRNRSRRNVSSNRYSGRDFGSSSFRNVCGKEVVGEIQEEWLSDEEPDEKHGVACDRDDEDRDDIIESRIQDLDSD
ncbi:hypothetical protein QJS10_CPB19g01786 [Acorus calamus]|uniref:HAT C-terminal dimerisation domain-containing protein n=1 Tax=Acorus calamus TaxID=4465 RepID=A0AAV9CFR3_ACOCL|nr:hypothetical protein QJS10_CPB19g01786 [Acorus calamus]